MNSRPQLQCWCICDNVHVDPATGKYFILGIFSNLRVRAFPARYPSMVWFLTIGDVSEGKHQLRIRMGLTMEDQKTVVEREFESPSPLAKINLVNQIREMVFEQAGEYAITIEVDDEPILVSTLGIAGPANKPA